MASAVGALGLLLPLALPTGCKGRASPATTLPPPGPQCGNADLTGDPGPAPLRRLTRFELGRTLADVLGADSALVAALPPDEKSADGFDDNATAYSVSTVHVQGWLELAEDVAATFVKDTARLKGVAGCDPGEDEPTCLPAFVRTLGGRLFRRPLTDEEVASLVNLATVNAANGNNANDGANASQSGVSAVIASLLQSASFLYRPEVPSMGPDPEPVGGQELATRLAYLLTSTAPDPTLMAAAASGQLDTDAGLLAEADRLLQTPRAEEAFQHFIEEWWELDGLATLQKDGQLFRSWSAAVPGAFAEETRLFLADLWATGPTLGALLSSSRTFVDLNLASFYGDAPPAGPGFQPLTRDPQRAVGLLTQGSFLATHAKANQTSPVLRGKFVRARLLCTPPPPPPADKVIVPPTVDPRLPTRERFSQHATDSYCSVCHKLMDPIGFAFEHFDAVGRWRDTDAGQSVDATGALTGTDVDGTLSGVADLAARLASSQDVRHCVATQWFRWAFGRDESTADDACTVQTLSEALSSSEGDLRSLMRATVLTPSFRSRRAGDAP